MDSYRGYKNLSLVFDWQSNDRHCVLCLYRLIANKRTLIFLPTSLLDPKHVFFFGLLDGAFDTPLYC